MNNGFAIYIFAILDRCAVDQFAVFFDPFLLDPLGFSEHLRHYLFAYEVLKMDESVFLKKVLVLLG